MGLTLLFAIAGALVLLVTLWAAFQPGMKALAESLTVKRPANLGEAA